MAEVSPTDLSPSMPGAVEGRFSALLRYSLSILSAGAGAIHIAVVQAHYEEYWAFGVFFAVAAWLQILWAIVIVARLSRPVALAGVAINAILVAVWVVSRTVGVPVGPEPGSPEAAEFVDVAATSFEVLLVVGSLALLSRGVVRRAMGRAALVSSTVLIGLAVMVLTTAAVISFSPEHEEPEPGHEEEEQTGEQEEGEALVFPGG
jgi:hypothetical protein